MKKFKELLISCIDEEITGSTVERLTKQINTKMNTGLMLLLSGVLIPLIMKYLES